MPSPEALSFLRPWYQQQQSYLAFCWRAMSNERRETKQVICIRKSMSNAAPAYKAKAFTAGMSDRAPKKKQVHSAAELSSIEGATSPTILPTCSSCVSSGSLWLLWKVCTKINILSTPTARTRNGIISKMISVAGMPMKPNIPTEAETDTITIITPNIPSVILLSIMKLAKENFSMWPKDRVM